MYDIVFLSYHEPMADKNWDDLKSRFPRSIRVSDIDGIVKAHQAAAKVCKTKYFWVVDADNVISPSFDFSFRWDRRDEISDRVAVWRARNNVNDLSYGYGGVKLLPRQAVLDVEKDATDFTTSISDNFHVIDEISSTTYINGSAFDAWRAGFRECVKLSSGIIQGSISEENAERLNIWTTYALDVPYRDYVLEGANQGEEYGEDNAGDPSALAMINDWSWLQRYFEKEYARG